MDNRTLIIGTEWKEVADLLPGRRQEVMGADTSLEGIRLFRDSRPATVVVDFDMPGGSEVIDGILSEDPTVQVIVLSAVENLETAMGELKNRAVDFIPRPIRPVEFEIALARAERFTGLQRRLRDLQNEIEGRVRREAAERVEVERFLAVRQIVDRMSNFISQVASDVHGGVKYFNELPYFVSIHSPDGKVLAANPTYIRHLGYRIHGSSWEIYSGKRAAWENCPVGRSMRSEDIAETRALVRYKSGARVPVIVHTAPIFNDDGEVVLVLEIFAGSKEVERLAQEVRSTQQRYQQLFDAVPNHIAVLDRRLRITAINRRFKEDFGKPFGKNFFDVMRPGKFPAFRDPITQTIKDGLPHQGELVVTDSDGDQYNMLAATAPIKTLAGKLVQVLVIFTDITRLRQLQDNLSSLGLMIGTVSHDLKGCLTGLDAGVYLIDTGFYRDQPGRIEEGLDVVRLMMERIRKQVQNILYYTKERTLELKTVDAEQFAADVAANVEQRIRGADIDFVCEFASKLGEIEIDADLVRSTLINILENAMEACLENGSAKSYHIAFRAASVEDGIEFEISDNGTGMNENQKKHMFTMFFTTKGSKGTGLGLFIANKTVQKHGGAITVDSTPGVGTTFRIRLPRRALEPAAAVLA